MTATARPRRGLRRLAAPPGKDGGVAEPALLAAIALGLVLAPLNSTMIAVALPALATDFHVGIGGTGWLVVGYLIAMAVVQPIAGGLGDGYGRRRVMLGALGVFLAASLLAAAAPTFPALVGLRLGQAVAGALIVPNGIALVREWVPKARRGAALGLLGAATGAAAGVGPLVGGLLVGLGGWRAIFVLNAPLVAAALLAGWSGLPRVGGRRAVHRFDLAGTALLAGWLGGLALVASAPAGTATGLPMPVLAAATPALLAAFVWREARAARPVVRLALFRERAFAGACAASALGNLAMYATLLAVPQFLTLVERRPSAEVGLVLSALSLPLVVLAPLAGRLADQLGRRPVALGGGALALAGFAPLLRLAPGWSPWLLAAPLLVAGCGLALGTPAIQAAAIEAVAVRHAGMASGVFSTSRYLGSIVGSAVLAGLLGPATIAAGGFRDVFAMVAVAALGALAACALLSGRASPAPGA
ncbi:MAG TPA: MFS transporter [Thermomicrobiales bacterium]|nr:MFS transporter [Thermomicrobiales bacterium]